MDRLPACAQANSLFAQRRLHSTSARKHLLLLRNIVEAAHAHLLVDDDLAVLVISVPLAIYEPYPYPYQLCQASAFIKILFGLRVRNMHMGDLCTFVASLQ